MPVSVGNSRLDRILGDVVARAVREIHPRRIWLFGSQARATATRTSDVDVAFDLTGAARERWSEFVIEASEEVPALVDLDLIDLDACETKLAHEILRTGRLVYERSP